MSEVRAKVMPFLQKNFYIVNPEGFTDDTSLLDQGIVDSTGVLEVITFLEEEFGITVDDAEMTPDNLDTVANIVAFVTRKRTTAT